MFCIIPARGGSKRLPRKNILNFHGDPIISYPIKAALASEMFEKVIVSSDDEEILSVAESYGATAVKRPSELATDEISEIEAYKHIRDKFYSEFFCAIYPCAVFVTKLDIIRSHAKIVNENSDVCMGVRKFQQHPYQMIYRDNGSYRLKFPGLNDQPYPDAYASNGSLYWFRNTYKLNYFPDKLSIYEVPNIDINTQEDFDKAVAVYGRSIMQGYMK